MRDSAPLIGRPDRSTFDYVIVGGGLAGCVLAARLSTDVSVRVLLLEAGPADRNPYIHIPAGASRLSESTYQWGLRSVPQRHCQDRVLPLAQARVIGGGSSINAQIYIRGVPSDYDHWQQLGAKGWSADDVREYFIRIEANQRIGAPLHGVAGPVSVTDLPDPHPLSLAWVDAGQQFGLPHNPDFNGPDQYGVGLYQVTGRNGRRSSTAVAYLRSARRRPNLLVRSRVTVSRVLVDRGRATGVEVIGRSGVRRYRATREVIVCAGAYGSPKLLMLSGIGPADHLRELGIPVQHDNPAVGQNLQDHGDLDVVYQLRSSLGLDRYQSPPLAALAAARYLTVRRGPLTSNGVEAGAFTYADHTEHTPDLQFHFIPAGTIDARFARLPRGQACTFNTYVVRPRSRGSVRLAGTDPSRPPVIDPNFLSDDADLELAIESLRQGRSIMAEPAMARFIAAERLPDGEDLSTRDGRIGFIRRNIRTACHPVGTCAMGVSADSVVDPELRVQGIANLRVADSSVMPALISGNTQAPTTMIAERAADLVLERNR